MTKLHAKKLYNGVSSQTNAVVTFDGNTIHGVESGTEGDFSFPVITPAFVDPHCHIGLIRGGEPGAEAEANEHLDSMLAHADVLDSIQMDDVGFAASIEAGVLYSCVLPGSGNIIGGNSAVIRNYGKHQNDAYIRRSGIKGAFGYNPMSTREWKGKRPYTRMGALAILRSKLHDVRAKIEKEQANRLQLNSN